MTWKNPDKAVALGRDDPIKDLAKKGLLTLKRTKTVVNCAIIKVLSGSMGAAVRVLEIINTALVAEQPAMILLHRPDRVGDPARSPGGRLVR
jgi:hypothetical protein